MNKHMIGVTALVVVAALTSACSGRGATDEGTTGTGSDGGALSAKARAACTSVLDRTRDDDAPGIIVVVDATASVADLPMPPGLEEDIRDASVADGWLSVIAVEGAGKAPRLVAKRAALSTPGERDRPSVAKLAGAMPGCVRAVYGDALAPTAPGTDLYRAVALAAEILGPDDTLWVVSDWLSNSGALDLDAGLLLDPASRAGRKAARRAPLDLGGALLRSAGIADASVPVQPADRTWVLGFARSLCAAWERAAAPSSRSTRSSRSDPTSASRVTPSRPSRGSPWPPRARAARSRSRRRWPSRATRPPSPTLRPPCCACWWVCCARTRERGRRWSATRPAPRRTPRTSWSPFPGAVRTRSRDTSCARASMPVASWPAASATAGPGLKTSTRGPDVRSPPWRPASVGSTSRSGVPRARDDAADPNAGPSQVLRDLRPVRRAPRLRAGLVLLLVLTLLAGLGLLWRRGDDEPRSLDDARLIGARAPGAISVVLLVDESGSFEQHAAMRETLLRQLAAWAPENLRPDDRVTVISFGADAVTRLAPVTVADLAAYGAAYRPVRVDSGSTSILPALEEAVRVAPAGVTTTLVAMTDTLVDDARREPVEDLVRELHADTATLIRPEGVEVAADWRAAFGWERVIVADPGSVGASGVALARAVASATRQKVEAAG